MTINLYRKYCFSWLCLFLLKKKRSHWNFKVLIGYIIVIQKPKFVQFEFDCFKNIDLIAQKKYIAEILNACTRNTIYSMLVILYFNLWQVCISVISISFFNKKHVNIFNHILEAHLFHEITISLERLFLKETLLLATYVTNS